MLRRAKNCAADTARSTREPFESVGVLLDSVSRKAVNLQAQAYIAEQCGRLQRQRRIDTMISPHEGETVTARLKSRNASGNCSELLNKMVTRTCSAGTDLGALRNTRRNVFSVLERARAHAARSAAAHCSHGRPAVRAEVRGQAAASCMVRGGKTGRCERRCGRKSRSASARSARKCGDTRTAVRGAETRAATAAESVAVTRGAARAGGRRRADSCSRTAARRAAEAGATGAMGAATTRRCSRLRRPRWRHRNGCEPHDCARILRVVVLQRGQRTGDRVLRGGVGAAHVQERSPR
ncbi:hypothetical protein FGB62_56g011 [Gracilaria domingensis]|nr:hypothetical protein FGB62_56g011 [Gracilaria domingensis]